MNFRRRPYGSSALQRSLWRRAVATWIIVIVNVFWFIVVEGTRGYNTLGLVASGALEPSGGWYRYISAMFVHFGILHIGLNMLSLGSLYVVELLIGTPAYIVVYLFSGVVGNIASAVLTPGIAAGASGAVFGVFGGALTLSFVGVLPKSIRNQLLTWLAINLVYDFSNPQIGTMAHLGGLVTGMLMTFAFHKRKGNGIKTRILAVVSVLGAGWALILAFLS
ncbi:rhomboid family intramembrane serine protease [Alicyclobacillus tolerans]|uniref:rhomboid family intramembrane serine protease n=1 Tax=Alicyclobacillus tolerans TaxID=90970 RepID=UPI001F222579|nr:rhomboid family intramembrane serine protease [Alicyclobacillus tolerans]MCF8564978.1 rhomboid family intramembrane serine protease [Alicyclobacillus tolerans]